MKFTDTFFEFPVRVYDEDSVIKEFRQKMGTIDPDQPQVEGHTFMEFLLKVPFEYLTNIAWQETYLWKDMDTAIKRESKREGWGKNGLNVTIPALNEDYLCTLTKAEFEDKLNNFMADLKTPSPQDKYDRADSTNKG